MTLSISKGVWIILMGLVAACATDADLKHCESSDPDRPMDYLGMGREQCRRFNGRWVDGHKGIKK